MPKSLSNNVDVHELAKCRRNLILSIVVASLCPLGIWHATTLSPTDPMLVVSIVVATLAFASLMFMGGIAGLYMNARKGIDEY